MLAWLPALPARAEPPPSAAAHDPAPVLVVDAEGLPADLLMEELRLRLPERTLLAPHAPRPPRPVAYAIVRRRDGRIELTLIVPEGYAYDRTLADDAGQTERVAASGLSALLDAIAAGELPPSRVDVAMPAADPGGTPSPRPEGAAAPRRARLEVGPFASPGVGLGLAPRTGASRWLGAGAVLGVDLVLRRGPAVTAEVRGLGRGAAGLGLGRLRLASGVGHCVRAGAFELPIFGLVTVEPWWLRQGGGSAPLVRDDAVAHPRPLLGAMARASPGVRLGARGSRAPRVRVGARLEASGSFVPDGGARVAEVGLETRGGREPLVRLGGLELGLGLEVAVWLDLPRARARPAPRAGRPAHGMGSMQKPAMHEPVQQSALAEHVIPVGTQSVGGSQAPAVHTVEQQSALPSHAWPSSAQSATHAPVAGSQGPKQQSPSSMQLAPSP